MAASPGKFYRNLAMFLPLSLLNCCMQGAGADSCGYGNISSLARSEDGGQSWQSYSLGCLIKVQQIAVLPAEPDVVYLSVLYYSAHTGTV